MSEPIVTREREWTEYKQVEVRRCQALETEVKRLRKLIRCEQIDPPFDVADDMTTEFAIELACAKAKIKQLQCDWAHNEFDRVGLSNMCDERLAEIERLQGIIDKLPKMADGVSVAPGMVVWEPDGKGGFIPFRCQGALMSEERCCIYRCNRPAKHRQLEDRDGTGLSRWFHYCDRHWKLHGDLIVLAVTEEEEKKATRARICKYSLFIQDTTRPAWKCPKNTLIRIEQTRLRSTKFGETIVVWEGEADDLGAEIEWLQTQNIVLTSTLSFLTAAIDPERSEETADWGLTDIRWQRKVDALQADLADTSDTLQLHQSTDDYEAGRLLGNKAMEAKIEQLQQQVVDTRNGLRLSIGRHIDRPWKEVTDADINASVDFARRQIVKAGGNDESPRP